MTEYDEIIDVSDDNILLQQVTQDHEVTAKQLAMLTGRAVSTVYKYLAGGSSIPSVVWRQLYRKTQDSRITRLVTGDVAVAIVPMIPVGKIDAPTLRRLVDNRKAQIKCEECVLTILADGRIDEQDARAVGEYKKTFDDMITSQHQIFYAVTGQFKLATQPGGSE